MSPSKVNGSAVPSHRLLKRAGVPRSSIEYERRRTAVPPKIEHTYRHIQQRTVEVTSANRLDPSSLTMVERYGRQYTALRRRPRAPNSAWSARPWRTACSIDRIGAIGDADADAVPQPAP